MSKKKETCPIAAISTNGTIKSPSEYGKVCKLYYYDNDYKFIDGNRNHQCKLIIDSKCFYVCSGNDTARFHIENVFDNQENSVMKVNSWGTASLMFSYYHGHIQKFKRDSVLDEDDALNVWYYFTGDELFLFDDSILKNSDNKPNNLYRINDSDFIMVHRDAKKVFYDVDYICTHINGHTNLLTRGKYYMNDYDGGTIKISDGAYDFLVDKDGILHKTRIIQKK